MLNPNTLAQDVRTGKVALEPIKRFTPEEFRPLKQDILMLVNEQPAEISANYGGVKQWTLFSPVADTSVPMRQAMATPGKIRFHHTGLYPVLGEFLAAMPELMTCRLIGVQPGGGVPKHKDANVAGNTVICRFHLPVLTDKDIDMELDGKLVQMEEGVIYLFNFGLEHRSLNRSTLHRLHLIWDLPLLPHVCKRLADGV